MSDPPQSEPPAPVPQPSGGGPVPRPWNRSWPDAAAEEDQDAATDRTREVPDTRSAAVAVLVTVGAFAVAGYAAARIWAGQTDVAYYKVTSTGAFLDESQLGLQFGADGWFFVTGLVGGLVVGSVLAGVFRRHGVVAVLAVLAGASLASYLSYQLGPGFGPGPLRARLATAQVGDLVSAPIKVTATGVVFSWPIGAMLGALVAQAILWRSDEPSAAARFVPNQKR